MVCTVAAIVAWLHYMPPPGTTITIPRSQITIDLTPSRKAKAERCAEKYGIKFIIDEDK